MVALLGYNATICVSNIFTVFFKRLETFIFLILILCLLDWLDFWAEVHLVQEVNCECNTFHKKNNQENSQVLIFSFCLLEWMECWAVFHLV